MQRAVGHTTIPVEAVRIGMDIHIDGGWLSHPFSRSRFVVQSAEQLAALLACGQRSVRVYGESGSTAPPAMAMAPVAMPPDAVVRDPGDLRALAALRHAPVRALPTLAAVDPGHAGIPPSSAASTAPLPGAPIDGELRFAAAAAAHAAVLAQLPADPASARGRAEAAILSLIDDLGRAGELRIRLLQSTPDSAESAHAVNVAVLSMMLGRTLGIDAAEMMDIGLGALLHDIGKTGLPTRAQVSGPQADPADARLYQSHVVRGVALGGRMGLSAKTTQIIAQHHEHLDGTGFPDQPPGDSLTPGARIVGLVDRYDRLCNPPGTVPACTPHQALSTLFQQQQSRFDGTILPAFIRMVGVYPPGSTVLLTDHRYALVTSIHASRPLKPTVIAFDDRADARHARDAPPLDLEHAGDVGVLRGVPRHEVPAHVLAALAPPQRVAYYAAPWEPLLAA